MNGLEWIRRGLRAIVYAGLSVRSASRLALVRLLYANVRIGRGVTVGRAVTIVVASRGTLVIGDRVVIGPNVHLMVEFGSLTIGDDSFIGDGCVIVAQDSIRIGRDALIAAYCTLRDQDHGFADPALPYRSQPVTKGPIAVGDNVWLGAHVTVLKGRTIGDNAIVGANSVVTADVAPGSVFAGNPARLIRRLGEDGGEA